MSYTTSSIAYSAWYIMNTLSNIKWHDVTSCVSPLGLSWKEECVELGKGVVPMHVPTIERVLVEWNENHTIWFIGPHIPDNKTMKETRQKNSIETEKVTNKCYKNKGPTFISLKSDKLIGKNW